VLYNLCVHMSVTVHGALTHFGFYVDFGFRGASKRCVFLRLLVSVVRQIITRLVRSWVHGCFKIFYAHSQCLFVSHCRVFSLGLVLSGASAPWRSKGALVPQPFVFPSTFYVSNYL